MDGSPDVQPFVSVVVPVRDGVKTIRACVTALLEGDYPQDRREVVVVDNGSRDGTAAALAGLPVVCVAERAVGRSHARNRGLDVSRGGIVAFVDADCIADPAWLSQLVGPFADPAVWGVAGEITARPPRTAAQRLMAEREAGWQRVALDLGFAITANVAFRREVFDRIGGFDPFFVTAEDVDFGWRFSRAGLRMAYCPGARVAHVLRRSAWDLGRQQAGLGHGRALLRERYDLPRGYGLPQSFELRAALGVLRRARSPEALHVASLDVLRLAALRVGGWRHEAFRRLAASVPTGNRKLVAAFPRMHLTPYGRLLYGALEDFGFDLVADPPLRAGWLWRNRRQVAVLHFHWEEADFRGGRPARRVLRAWAGLVRRTGLLILARGLGYRIVWTIHEVVPHEARDPARDWLAGRILASASHALVAHDHATAVRAREMLLLGRRRIDVIPHGSFVEVHPPGRPRPQVRNQWGLDQDAFVFLAFGNLRAYKRIDLLLEAFDRVEDPRAALVVAGEFVSRSPQPDFERVMRARLALAADQDPRVRVRIGRVADDEVVELHAACDAFVLARGDGWTSASPLLAMSCGLPVVAARRPAYVDLLGHGAAGWFFEPDDVRSLAQTLQRVGTDRSIAKEKARAARRVAAALLWVSSAEMTASVLDPHHPAGKRRRDRRGR